MVKYKDKNIIYTLKYSGYTTRRQKIYLFSLSIFMVFLGMVIFTILMIDNDVTTAVLFLVLFCVLGLPLLFILIYDISATKKHDNVIYKWITDEELFETTAIPWEFSSTGGLIVHYKFGVDFDYNGKTYRKISSNYNAFYKFIKGKEIRILYSPKYDEVMIIEN